MRLTEFKEGLIRVEKKKKQVKYLWISVNMQETDKGHGCIFVLSIFDMFLFLLFLSATSHLIKFVSCLIIMFVSCISNTLINKLEIGVSNKPFSFQN